MIRLEPINLIRLRLVTPTSGVSASENFTATFLVNQKFVCDENPSLPGAVSFLRMRTAVRLSCIIRFLVECSVSLPNMRPKTSDYYMMLGVIFKKTCETIRAWLGFQAMFKSCTAA